MRRAAQIDQNQPAIVKALLQAGCSVVSLAAVGDGVPDLLAHAPTWPHANVLLEIKNPERSSKQRELRKKQTEFHASWKGPCFVVTTADEALAAMGVLR